MYTDIILSMYFYAAIEDSGDNHYLFIFNWVGGLKGLELLSANDGSFEINQLLFADDTALVADSEEKLCRLVSEFGRACERRKFRMKE